MSSIRLFILGSLAERGEMHGHALRHLAEEEHIDLWTDFTASAIYGAIKRLIADGLIEDVRTEREGNYPERQIVAITDAGSQALDDLRLAGLTEIAYRPDPVDLALARLDPDRLAELETSWGARLDRLRKMAETLRREHASAEPHLSLMERHVLAHGMTRLDGEIRWHEDVMSALPDILEDELSRKGRKS